MGRKRHQRRTVHFSPPDTRLDMEYDERSFLQRLIQQLEHSLAIAREQLDRLRDQDSSIK